MSALLDVGPSAWRVDVGALPVFLDVHQDGNRSIKVRPPGVDWMDVNSRAEAERLYNAMVVVLGPDASGTAYEAVAQVAGVSSLDAKRVIDAFVRWMANNSKVV